jgi:hypothetical protein
MNSTTRFLWQIVAAVPLALVIVAEAAWVSVLAGLVQAVGLHPGALGLATFIAFVAAGAVLARLVGRRLGERWPTIGLALTLVAAVIGWLIPEETRAAMAQGGLEAAIGASPGGFVAGLALLRGYAHASLPLAESTVERLLAIGFPVVALAALLGGAVAEPARSAFQADAFGAAIVLAGTTALALPLVRLTSVGRRDRLDWRRNPVWLTLLAVLVVAGLIAGAQIAPVARRGLELVFGLALAPALVIGLLLGVDPVWRRVIGLFGLVAVAIVVVGHFLGDKTPNPPVTNAPATPFLPASDPAVSIGIGMFVLGLAFLIVLVLIRAWMRQRPDVVTDVDEVRWIDRGEADRDDRPRFRRWRRLSRRSPATAVEAYVALMADIADRRGVAREPSETPAEHARRLRGDRTGAFGLDLLAADYALARYGGLPLGQREDQRAVRRWRILRGRLGKG